MAAKTIRIPSSGREAQLFSSLKNQKHAIETGLRLLLSSEHAWIFFNNLEQLRELYSGDENVQSVSIAVAPSGKKENSIKHNAQSRSSAQNKSSSGEVQDGW